MKNIAVILFVFLISSCAANNKADPFESVNRKVYVFNDTIDKALLRPLAYMYKDLMPDWGKDRISNALTNLTEPVTLVNSALQLDGKHVVTTGSRFLINSTFGLLGTFDVAQKIGLEHRAEDFGQTAAVYNIEAGPYLYLPIVGPSTLRGATGRIFDFFINPLNYVDSNAVQYGVLATNTVAVRYDLLGVTEEVEKFSFDPYTTIRSGYLQHRQKEIENR